MELTGQSPSPLQLAGLHEQGYAPFFSPDPLSSWPGSMIEEPLPFVGVHRLEAALYSRSMVFPTSGRPRGHCAALGQGDRISEAHGTSLCYLIGDVLWHHCFNDSFISHARGRPAAMVAGVMLCESCRGDSYSISEALYHTFSTTSPRTTCQFMLCREWNQFLVQQIVASSFGQCFTRHSLVRVFGRPTRNILENIVTFLRPEQTFIHSNWFP